MSASPEQRSGHGEQPAHHRHRMLLRRQGLDGPPAALQRDPRHRFGMRVRRAGPEHRLQPRQAITEGLITAERADREVADRHVQPAQTLRIAQAPHGRPLPDGGHERGLNQVIGQSMVPRVRAQVYPNKPGRTRQNTPLAPQRGPSGSGHRSPEPPAQDPRSPAAAAPHGRTTGPTTRAAQSQPDSTGHRRHSGALLRQTAGSHERGSDDRQGPATAACPPRQGRCPHASVAASVQSASIFRSHKDGKPFSPHPGTPAGRRRCPSD
jgi:hypothetical protein